MKILIAQQTYPVHLFYCSGEAHYAQASLKLAVLTCYEVKDVRIGTRILFFGCIILYHTCVVSVLCFVSHNL